MYSTTIDQAQTDSVSSVVSTRFTLCNKKCNTLEDIFIYHYNTVRLTIFE